MIPISEILNQQTADTLCEKQEQCSTAENRPPLVRVESDQELIAPYHRTVSDEAPAKQAPPRASDKSGRKLLIDSDSDNDDVQVVRPVPRSTTNPDNKQQVTITSYTNGGAAKGALDFVVPARPITKPASTNAYFAKEDCKVINGIRHIYNEKIGKYCPIDDEEARIPHEKDIAAGDQEDAARLKRENEEDQKHEESDSFVTDEEEETEVSFYRRRLNGDKNKRGSSSRKARKLRRVRSNEPSPERQPKSRHGLGTPPAQPFIPKGTMSIDKFQYGTNMTFLPGTINVLCANTMTRVSTPGTAICVRYKNFDFISSNPLQFISQGLVSKD